MTWPLQIPSCCNCNFKLVEIWSTFFGFNYVHINSFGLALKLTKHVSLHSACCQTDRNYHQKPLVLIIRLHISKYGTTQKPCESHDLQDCGLCVLPLTVENCPVCVWEYKITFWIWVQAECCLPKVSMGRTATCPPSWIWALICWAAALGMSHKCLFYYCHWCLCACVSVRVCVGLEQEGGTDCFMLLGKGL